jgi:hypothetical protein
MRDPLAEPAKKFREPQRSLTTVIVTESEPPPIAHCYNVWAPWTHKATTFTSSSEMIEMEVDSTADSRFADGTRNFVNWFQGLPGATFRADLIAVEDLRGRNAGRGIGE